VENVYLANLTLKMMKAYADGDIVDKIKTTLLSNTVAVEKFTSLCDNEYCGSLPESDRKEIMKYIMERYANMRGTFFVRHLKGNCSGNLVDQLAKSQATRAKVAASVVSAKAVAESNGSACTEEEKEKLLWDEAGENAIAYADRVEEDVWIGN
jgi:hypothetical protein